MEEPDDGPSALEGNLLCAVPQLSDPNFRRSVVLMLDHGRAGALGLVLNQPVPHTMADVAQSLGVAWKGPPDALARSGGPVEPMRGWILHGDASWDPHARAVLPGVYLTTSMAPMQRSEDGIGGAGRFLFLLGYAGWGPGQLEGEMALGSWVVVPLRGSDGPMGLSAAWVFDADPADMWDEALASIGVDPARLVGHAGFATLPGRRPSAKLLH